MDVLTQLLVAAGARGRLGRAGLALPSAMFALVALSVLLVGLFAIADLSAKAVRNRQSAARAAHVAEAGLAHAVGTLRGSLKSRHFTRLLRGSDSLAGSLDDTLLIGWGLAANQEIPAGGKTIVMGTDTGRYYVTLFDDDADPDGNATLAQKVTDLNGRLLARCKGVTSDGAVAEVAAIVGAIPFPAFAANGDVTLAGSASIRGACGGGHANGNFTGNSNDTVETQVTATGTASGAIKGPTGSPVPMLSNQPTIAIPTLNPLQYCAGADYTLRASGWVYRAATNDSVYAGSNEYLGWKRSSGPPEVKWDLAGDNSANGTYCVEGNANVGGNTGSAANPRKMSIVATGSIAVSGNPYITAEHDEGVMLLAGGDVSISGNPDLGSDAYAGMIYAGSQCKVSGNPVISGQILCANQPQPANAIDHTSVHDLSGNFKLRFDCSANVFNKRRVLFWYPKVGV